MGRREIVYQSKAPLPRTTRRMARWRRRARTFAGDASAGFGRGAGLHAARCTSDCQATPLTQRPLEKLRGNYRVDLAWPEYYDNFDTIGALSTPSSPLSVSLPLSHTHTHTHTLALRGISPVHRLGLGWLAR